MVDSIIKQCVQKSDGIDHLSHLKTQWQDANWPTSKQEIWRYAKLHWLNEAWLLASQSGKDIAYDTVLSQYNLKLKETDLVSVEGQFITREINGVNYFSADALNANDMTWSDDFFNQLGCLGLNDWASIEVAPGQQLDSQWHCILDQAKGWQNLKLTIHVKKDAHLRLRMNVMAAQAVTNLSLNVKVEQGGSCQIVSWASPQSKLIIDHNIDLQDRSDFRYDALNFEASWCHERIYMTVGAHANAMLSGLLLPGKGQSDHKAIHVNHIAPSGQSMQKFYSVADADGLAAFHGRAIVGQTAPKTNARQLARAVMLSKACEVYSRPELEIDIDDVQCQHGSSIGELDQKALFYLRSRGITLDEAKSMLIHGFIEEVVTELDPVIQGWVRDRIGSHAIGRGEA